MGLLIQHLKECVEGYNASMEDHQRKTHKLEGGNLGAEDVRTVSVVIIIIMFIVLDIVFVFHLIVNIEILKRSLSFL